MIKIFRIWLLVLLSGVIFSAQPAQGQFDFMEAELVGKLAPDFTLDTLKKSDVNFHEYRDGQRAILFFWATWCPHCRTQLIELEKQRTELEKQNIRLVLIDIGESKKIVEKYINKNQIEFDVFLDVDFGLESEYQIIGVPTFYYVNEQGNITSVGHSLPDDYETFLSKS